MKDANCCTFYIVRHGETEWNVKGLLQGQADSALTQTGIEQAHRLKQKFKDILFDAAFSSDLDRAHHTATIIAFDKKLPVQKKEAIRERNFGKWEGRHHTIFNEELKEMLGEFLSLPDEKKKIYKYPDIESDEEMMVRFIPFLKQTAATHAGKTVLMVTHGSLMRAFLIYLGVGTYDEIPSRAVANTAFVKLVSDGITFCVEDMNGVTKLTATT